MLHRVGRPDWQSESVRLAAAATLVLGALLLFGVYVFWDAGYYLILRTPDWLERVDGLLLFFIPWEPLFVLAVGLAGYWTLRFLGRDRMAFWLVSLVVVFPHMVLTSPRSRIDWQEFLDVWWGASLSASMDVVTFIACLVGLVVLHRIMGIERLERRMSARGVIPEERRRILRYEGLMLIALIAAGLLLTGLLALIAIVLSRYDGLLDGSPLTVGMLGGGAVLLLALTLLLWFRESPGEPESG